MKPLNRDPSQSTTFNSSLIIAKRDVSTCTQQLSLVWGFLARGENPLQWYQSNIPAMLEETAMTRTTQPQATQKRLKRKNCPKEDVSLVSLLSFLIPNHNLEMGPNHFQVSYTCYIHFKAMCRHAQQFALEWQKQGTSKSSQSLIKAINFQYVCLTRGWIVVYGDTSQIVAMI